ncbi:GAF domain-containing protein [bacterium]|nr:GAF domain-containing protein [bacterium]
MLNCTLNEEIFAEIIDTLTLSQNEKMKFLNKLNELHKKYSNQKDYEAATIYLTLIAMAKYLNNYKYNEILDIIKDVEILKKNIQSLYIDAVYNFVNAYISYLEGDFNQGKNYENKLKLISVSENFLNKLMFYLRSVKRDTSLENLSQKAPLLALLKIAREVSAETNIDNLLQIIAEETKLALNADRCSVFLYDKDTNELWSKIALGIEAQEIRFSANKGLAGHVARTGETINIKDAYNDERFNKEIDLQTGYVTKTILCMPMRNVNHDIVGVFQVLNKKNGVFSTEDEDLMLAIGSNAGISLENARLFHHQQKMFEEQKYLFKSFIDTLAASIDARDKITSGHSTRVKMYSALIAKQMGLPKKQCETIEQAAILHDIGKIGIRDSVLQKEGKLTDEEYIHIQQHVKITHDILSRIYISEEFKDVVEYASTHHEKYDGSGYFRKLKGEEIPLGGRVLAVSDVFDAITSKRHYRDKMPIKNALDIIKNGENSHFDKKIVDIFFEINLDKIAGVFITEYDFSILSQDIDVLKKHTLKDLYDILLKEETELTEYEKCLKAMFNHYYENRQE